MRPLRRAYFLLARPTSAAVIARYDALSRRGTRLGMGDARPQPAQSGNSRMGRRSKRLRACWPCIKLLEYPFQTAS